MTFTKESIPDQHGKTAVVTGANAGIGFATARALAEAGAHVVLACRSEERGREAVEKIASNDLTGSTELILLDLADIEKVKTFAGEFTDTHDKLDILVNNAGVMVPPEGKTADGFELQFGVNVAGHFALTGLLLPALEQAEAARIVTLSSIAHRQGEIDFDNLHGEKKYDSMREYSQSKLGNLIFALELERRLREHEKNTISLAAHPGVTSTDLGRHSTWFRIFTSLFANSAETGALPTLLAATNPEVEGGDYLGPQQFSEMLGSPGPAKIAEQAKDQNVARRLWQVLGEETGVHYLT